MAKVASKVRQLGFEHFKAKAFKFYGRCKQGLLTSPGWSEPWPGGVHAQREGASMESSDQTVPNVFMQYFMQSCKGVCTQSLQESLVSEDPSRVWLSHPRLGNRSSGQRAKSASPPFIRDPALIPLLSAHTQGSGKFIKSSQDFLSHGLKRFSTKRLCTIII